MNVGAIVGICAAAAGFTGISVWNYRRFMPAARPLGEQKYKVDIKTIEIHTEGRTVYGEFLSPRGIDGPLPTLICCHGYGSSYKLTKNAIGLPFAMSGYGVYCFDFCGGSTHSKSSGNFHDMTIFTEKRDLLAVIDEIKTLPEVDPSRLYLLGESQGGMVAGITAPERKEDIRAMVLYYPAFCIPFDARSKFPSQDAIGDEVEAFRLKIGGSYYRSVYDFDVYNTIRAYDRPVLIMHGDHDEVVPMKYGEKAASVYPDARFIRFPGEIHGFYGKGKRKAAVESYRFFEGNR